jgi:hypothetical protein
VIHDPVSASHKTRDRHGRYPEGITRVRRRSFRRYGRRLERVLQLDAVETAIFEVIALAICARSP